MSSNNENSSTNGGGKKTDENGAKDRKRSPSPNPFFNFISTNSPQVSPRSESGSATSASPRSPRFQTEGFHANGMRIPLNGNTSASISNAMLTAGMHDSSRILFNSFTLISTVSSSLIVLIYVKHRRPSLPPSSSSWTLQTPSITWLWHTRSQWIRILNWKNSNTIQIGDFSSYRTVNIKFNFSKQLNDVEMF